MSTNIPRTNFANGFYQLYGRYPTEEDFSLMRERNQARFDSQFPEPPSDLERAAAVFSPLLGYAGMKGIDSLMGGGGGDVATQALGATAGLSGAGVAGAGLSGAGSASLGLGALPAYQSPIAGGVSFGLGGASTGAAGAGGAGTAGAGLGSAALPVAGAAAYLGGLGYTGYQAYDAFKGDNRPAAQKYTAGLGSLLGLAGGPIGVGLGAAGGALLGKAFTGGKDKFQKGRDDIRAAMQRTGLIDDNYQYEGFDVGKDGGFRLDDGRKIYEVIAGQEDGAVWDDPEISADVAKLNPLGALFMSDYDEADGYGTGMLYNMLAETGEDGVTDAEILGLYDRMGLTPQEVASTLDVMADEGSLDRADADVFINDLGALTGGTVLDENVSPSQRASDARRVREVLFA